jgi:hypothetical protein
VEALQEFVDNFTYIGVFAVLLLGSLGVPIPEDMPIIAAAVLSHEGIVRWWVALPICLLGVIQARTGIEPYSGTRHVSPPDIPLEVELYRRRHAASTREVWSILLVPGDLYAGSRLLFATDAR